MKTRNRILTILMIAALVLSSVAAAFASTADDAEKKRKQAEEASRKAEAARQKAEEAEENAEEAETEYWSIQKDIEEQQKKIDDTEVKIRKKEKEIDSQTEALNDRLTAMYKTGSIGFIDVILNSEGIEDLLSNMGMVSMILKSDQELLTKLEEDLAEVEALKKQQESQKAVLVGKQNDAEEAKQKWEAEMKRQNITAEKEQKEADKLKAEAEELARKAAAEANNAEISGAFTPTPNGQYAWPTDSNYFFTSWYGWRVHPIFGIKKYHSGYDICLTGGSYGKPLYSVGDGVVTMSSSYGGYGNCLMISIGNGYTTLYGHLSGFAVSAGQTVKKGQVVGYIGSTGWSTGPHLHFSLMKNGSLVDPMILYQ